MSHSVAALVHGFASYGDVQLAGVVLNRVGSDRHEQLLREALDGKARVLGVLRRDDGRRHPEPPPRPGACGRARPGGRRHRAAARRAVRPRPDLDALLQVARSAPDLTDEPWAAPRAAGAPRRPVVAVAGGPAFTFSYAETPELLTAAGADVVVVDPLRDEQLPAGHRRPRHRRAGSPRSSPSSCRPTRGLRDDVARLAATGAPVAAECAGLLYLCERLDGLPMCGVLPAAATMTPRLTLGYRTAAATAGWVGDAVVTGHEFHRTTVEPRAGTTPAWDRRRRARGLRLQAACTPRYLHLHWAGTPGWQRPSSPRRRTAVTACASSASASGPATPSCDRQGRARAQEADLVVVPVMDPHEQGRAEATVRAHVTHDRLQRLVFALDDRGGATAERLSAWEAAADAVAEHLRCARRHGGVRDDRRPERLQHLHLPGRRGARARPGRRGRDRPGHHRHAGPRRPVRARSCARAPSRSRCCR